MALRIPFEFWDWLLILGVSGLATVLAYIRQPLGKALLAMVPVPFTLAALALGVPMSPSHVAALPLLLGYYASVRLFHVRWRWPIIPSILAGMMLYGLVGWALAPWLAERRGLFWVLIGLDLAGGLLFWWGVPPRRESEHRTRLPVPVKWLIVVLVVGGVILLKRSLQGFACVFPMVGVLACYESRHSLYTIQRQSGLLLLSMTPMLAAIRVLTPGLGLGRAILAGWLVHVPLMVLIVVDTRRRLRRVGAGS